MYSLHVVCSPDCTVKLSLWRDDATRAGFTQTVAYSERLRVAHTGRLSVAYTGRLSVAYTGRLSVAYTGRLCLALTA